ncbi:MAG: hypothetical protein DRI57_16915 [Deltaproteobacteria bacterium]|nr:MAG: hypothetical protein DRI57_16915 [Deltaproteobacteria bacterium]
MKIKNQKLVPGSDRGTEIRNNKVLNIRCDLLICLFLILATLSVYWQVRDYAFVNFDDNAYIYENPYVRAGLTRESIAWAFTAAHSSNWHPLTWLSHMLDVQLYGLNPGQHHLTNVLLHILNTLLLFFLLRRMTRALWPSSFVAALFALHPLHVESVAWVAERKDVLSTFFWVLTLHYYVRYVERPGRTAYLTTILLFIMGLMSKPMVVTLPFVLLLLDYWPLRRFSISDCRFPAEEQEKSKTCPRIRPGIKNLSSAQTGDQKTKIIEKFPFFALSAASSVVTFLVQQSAGATASMDIYPFYVRLANALVSYITYIVKMVYPYQLAVFYPHPGMRPWWEIAGASLLLISITVFVIRYAKSHPYLIVGWLWYMGTLVPVIGLVQVGLQAMADRYTYIPLIGLFIMMAWGVPDLAQKWRYGKLTMVTTAAVFVSLFTAASWLQTQHWANSVTLFQHSLEITQGSYKVHANLGNALARQGRLKEALKHYSQALRILPDMAAEVHNNIGAALIHNRKFKAAKPHIQEALRLAPGHVKAHKNLKIIADHL